MKMFLFKNIFNINLLIFFLVIISFGRIVFLNFGTDDYVNFYILNISKELLSYPYHIDFIRLGVLFNFFRLNPAPYYAVALFFFFVSALLVKYLAKLMFKKDSVALIASVVYIFSFIGDASMYTVFESVRHTQYLTIQLATICFYIFSLQRKKKIFYFIAVISFLATTYIFPYRAYTLILIILFSEIFFRRGSFNITTPINIIMRLIPFFLIDFRIYPHSTTGFSLSSFNPSIFLPKTIHSVADLRNTLLQKSALFLYLFIPNTFFTSKNLLTPLLGNQTIIHPVFFLMTFFSIFGIKEKEFKKGLLFCLLTIVIVLLGFSIVFVDYQYTGHRYLITVRPFFAIFAAGIIASLISKLNFRTKKFLIILPIIIIVFFTLLLHLKQHYDTQNEVLYYRGSFSKNAVLSIRKSMPSIKNYTIIFIDGESLDQFSGTFRNVGTPAWVFMPYYKISLESIDVVDPKHCDIFEYLVAHHKKYDLYYFIATSKGVINNNSNNAYLRCGLKI